MKKNFLTTIEITDTHVKLFQSRSSRNKRIITFCDVKPISDYTDEGIIKSLAEITRSRDIQTDHLVFVIPRRQTILKQMKLPSQNEEEIKKMVALQLVNKIPYPLEDVSYNCYILGKDGQGHAQVLVIVVHKEVSDRYLKIFEKVGLTLNRLTLSSLGILEWLEYQKRHSNIKEDGAIAVINVDATQTEICFCDHGKLFYSRGFDYGAKDLDEHTIFNIIKQCELSLAAYQKENWGPPIGVLLIVSTVPEAMHLREKLEDQMKIMTGVFAPAENVRCQKNIDLSAMRDKFGVSISVGLGVSLSDARKLVNLAPQKVHDTKQGKIRKSRWVKFIFLFPLVCILGSAILGSELYQKTAYLNKIKDQGQQIKSQLQNSRQQAQFVKAFNDEVKRRVYIADLMKSLYDLTPSEISFRSLNLDGKRNFTIQGYGETGRSVNNFQAALMKSAVFQDVSLQFSTKRKVFNTEITDFKINSRLTVAKELNND